MCDLESESLLQLAGVYGLLGRLWYSEIDLETLEALNETSFKPAFLKLGGKLPNKIDAQTVEMLAVDYCQLLVGPKDHLPPIQSIWTEAIFQSECAASMKRYFDLLPEFNAPASLPDHLGVQLKYLSELFAQASQGELEDQFEDLANKFFEKHLRWPQRFLEKVEAKAETEFYRGLAALTRDFLASAHS